MISSARSRAGECRKVLSRFYRQPSSTSLLIRRVIRVDHHALLWTIKLREAFSILVSELNLVLKVSTVHAHKSDDLAMFNAENLSPARPFSEHEARWMIATINHLPFDKI
jgi:hypothetical protein